MKGTVELTQKENDIIEKTEDAILRQVEIFTKIEDRMSETDCRNLQTLVCTLGRIRAIKGGNNFSNYPD